MPMDEIALVLEPQVDVVVEVERQGPPGPRGLSTIAAADDVDTASLEDGGVFVFNAKDRVFRATSLVLDLPTLSALMAEIPTVKLTDPQSVETLNKQAVALNAKIEALAALVFPLTTLAK